MSRIAKRVFGAPLPDDIVKKLQKTEDLGAGRGPLESQALEDSDMDSITFGGQGFYSSKTPFARLWTAVSVVEKTGKKHNHNPADFVTEKNGEYEVSGVDFKNKRYKFKQDSVDEDESIEVEDIIRTPDPEITGTIGKVYVIGTYNSREGDKSYLDPQEADLNQLQLPNQRETYTELDSIRTEANTNRRLKPPAGITSVRSTTQNAQGPLSGVLKTTIEFKVYDFQEYDKIFSKYFLRPGAQMFLDFGWTNKKNFTLYNPNDLLKDDDGRGKYNNIIYGETDKNGNVTKTGQWQESDYDIQFVQGQVTNASADLDPATGAWNCSIDILSMNTTIANPSLEEEGLTGTAKKNMLADIDWRVIKVAADQLFPGLFIDANKSFSTEDEDEWEKLAALFASEYLASPDWNTPSKTNTKLGIYWRGTYTTKDNPNVKGEKMKVPSTKEDAIYVSWGWFEDVVLNGELGKYFTLGDKKLFGTKAPANFVGYDSSCGMTRYTDSLLKRQQYLKDGHRQLPFLLPENWDNTYNTDFDKGTTDGTETDKLNDLIPIREVFIQLNLIKTAFAQADNLGEFFKYISNVLEDSTGRAWKWQMDTADVQGFTRGFCDLMQTGITYSDVVNQDNTARDKKTIYDDLYKFKVYSPTSIVQNMSLRMNLGGGDMIASKLALSGLGDSGRVKMAMSEIIDQMQSIELLEAGGKDALGKFEVEYLPSHNMSEFEKLLINEVNPPLEIADPTYLSATTIYGGSTIDIKKTPAHTGLVEAINKKTSELETKKADPRVEPAKTDTHTYTKRKAELEKAGYLFSESLYDYFTDIFITDTVAKRPTILPVDVQLQLHGISAFQPGDIFDIAFLPERYRNQVFFQVWSVQHSISPGSFNTSLTTKMRFRDDRKIAALANESWTNKEKKVCSPYMLTKTFGLKGFQKVLPFMQWVKPVYWKKAPEFCDYMFKFTTLQSGTTANIDEIFDITFDISSDAKKEAALEILDSIKLDNNPGQFEYVYKGDPAKEVTLSKKYVFENSNETKQIYTLYIYKDKWFISDNENSDCKAFFKNIVSADEQYTSTLEMIEAWQEAGEWLEENPGVNVSPGISSDSSTNYA